MCVYFCVGTCVSRCELEFVLWVCINLGVRVSRCVNYACVFFVCVGLLLSL